MASAGNDARLNFRLAPELKQTIEQAAAEMGLTVSDFAIAALVQSARKVLDESEHTRLSNRDRAIFLKMLDDQTAKPNAALKKAAKRYVKRVR
ncbi:MAG: DUF1778 domain-containing protein [Pirellulaceae bacterium]